MYNLGVYVRLAGNLAKTVIPLSHLRLIRFGYDQQDSYFEMKSLWVVTPRTFTAVDKHRIHKLSIPPSWPFGCHVLALGDLKEET